MAHSWSSGACIQPLCLDEYVWCAVIDPLVCCWSGIIEYRQRSLDQSRGLDDRCAAPRSTLMANLCMTACTESEAIEKLTVSHLERACACNPAQERICHRSGLDDDVHDVQTLAAHIDLKRCCCPLGCAWIA
jgi:hypothetical protein